MRNQGRNQSTNLESVDNALRLLLLLSRGERLRVSDVASELDVAASTAHRLLSTLKYRDFVVQDPDRSYRPGPAFAELGSDSRAPAAHRSLEDVSLPHLEALKRELRETSHLVVRQGHEVRFLASVEGTQELRVTSRAGATMPAHLVSGGRALLAEVPATELAALYPASGVPEIELDGAGVAALLKELAATRRRGYGMNRAESERGIAAIALTIHGPDGRPLGAFSISVPTVRFSSHRVLGLVAAARETRTAIEADLAGSAGAESA